MGAAEAGVAGRGMACHACPCGDAAEGGVDVIDVEGQEEAAPTPSARKRKAQPPPPQGDTDAPPPKAPRTAIPAERAEQAAGQWQRGAVGEGVEQQHKLHRAGVWEVPAMSSEAANRDLETRPSAIEDRRAAKTRLADLTKERDRLAARPKTPERDFGTARKAAGAQAKPPAKTGEGAEGAEGPTVEGAGGGPIM